MGKIERVCGCVCTHVLLEESTVCVNKALSWASIKPLSTQCLSFSETLSDGNLLLLLQFNVPAISWWKERERRGGGGGSEWASIVLCSRQSLTHTYTHAFDKSQTLHAPLQWNQCSQFSSLCKAAHSATGFLWSNTTSCSATSDTDANTVLLLCFAVAVHSHCIQSQ